MTSPSNTHLTWDYNKPDKIGWWWCITPYYKEPSPVEIVHGQGDLEGVLVQKEYGVFGDVYEVSDLLDDCLWAGPFFPPMANDTHESTKHQCGKLTSPPGQSGLKQ